MAELVELVCPHCGQPLRIPKEHAGKTAKCGTCEGLFSTKTYFEGAGHAAASDNTNPFTSPSSDSAATCFRPHRGGLILALAIIGWVVCPIVSVVAWVMGQSDLNEIKAGRMDPEGKGLTQAGMIIAIVQLAFLVIALFFWMIAAFIGIGFGVFN